MERDEELKQKIIEKLEQELNSFKQTIKEKGVDYAIDKAYELTAKQEIIGCFECEFNLSKTQIRALMAKENVLDELYDDWISFNGNMREDIYFCVDESLDKITYSYMQGIKMNKKFDR